MPDSKLKSHFSFIELECFLHSAETTLYPVCTKNKVSGGGGSLALFFQRIYEMTFQFMCIWVSVGGGMYAHMYTETRGQPWPFPSYHPPYYRAQYSPSLNQASSDPQWFSGLWLLSTGITSICESRPAFHLCTGDKFRFPYLHGKYFTKLRPQPCKNCVRKSCCLLQRGAPYRGQVGSNNAILLPAKCCD